MIYLLPAAWCLVAILTIVGDPPDKAGGVLMCLILAFYGWLAAYQRRVINLLLDRGWDA